MIAFLSFIFPLHARKCLHKVLGNKESDQNGQKAAIFPDHFSSIFMHNDLIMSWFRFQQWFSAMLSRTENEIVT